jgi:hypothetical protein
MFAEGRRIWVLDRERERERKFGGSLRAFLIASPNFTSQNN